MVKAFVKQIKTIEDPGQKQVEALNTLKSNNQLTIQDVISKNALNNDEAKKELDKIKEIEKTVDREKLVYKTNEYTYTFKNFQTTKTFGRDIYEGNITLKAADEYQAELLIEIVNFKKKAKQNVFDAFESYIFAIKSKDAGILNSDYSKYKILTTKQMLQRLPIALALVKAGSNSKSLSNEIRKIVYSLYQSKQITKKVYNNIIKSIQL